MSGYGPGERRPGFLRRAGMSLAVGALVGWLVGSKGVGALAFVIVLASAEIRYRSDRREP